MVEQAIWAGGCTLDPLQCSRAAGHTLSHSALPSLLSTHCPPCALCIAHCLAHCLAYALHNVLHTALPVHYTLPSPFFAHTAFALHTYFSSQHTLLRLRCTAQGWVHFWWDDSNGLVVHSAEGQKRPQAGACTMGRAITHCTHCTRFTLHIAHGAHCTRCTVHTLLCKGLSRHT